MIDLGAQHKTARMRCFAANRVGRDYAVGDIHGCFGRLQSLLAHVEFDRTADRLFAVGDLIDRGPDSERVCEWLDQPWFHAIRGNHEAMLLDAVRIVDGVPSLTADAGLWHANGGGWFTGLQPAAQIEIRQAIDNLPWAIEVAVDGGRKAALVHADVSADSWPATRALLDSGKSASSMAEPLDNLLWSRARAAAAAQALTEGGADAVSVAGIDMVCFGHTPMRWPLAIGNTRWLDTGAVYGGDLAVTELVPEGRVWAMRDEASIPVTGWHGGV